MGVRWEVGRANFEQATEDWDEDDPIEQGTTRKGFQAHMQQQAERNQLYQ